MSERAGDLQRRIEDQTAIALPIVADHACTVLDTRRALPARGVG